MLRTAFISLLTLCMIGPPTVGRTAAPVYDAGDDADPITKIRELPARAMNEVVWLARCMYSESNRPHEQRLVGWVVRNRVETEFRGRTYREVILTPRQFSAFNEPSPRRRHLLNLTLDSESPGWQKVLDVAYRVYTAPPEERPFPITTRHFYSPVSRSSEHPPSWVDDHTPLPSASLGVLPHRFKFYDGIDRPREETEIPPALARARPQQAAASSSSEEPRVSLKELRKSVRRRVFRGRIQRPRRPTVENPSRPDRQN